MLFPTDAKPERNLSPELFAVCLLLACSLQIMENLIPRIPIFPWLRLGLSYWILLPFLLRFGVLHTLFLFLSRNLITLVYGGQIFSSFLISTSAGMVSLIVIGPLAGTGYQRKKLGLFGVSVLLAASFNVCQLVVVDRLLIRHQDFYFQLSPILVWSLISGGLIAFLVTKSSKTLEGLLSSSPHFGPRNDSYPISKLELRERLELGLSFATFLLIFFIDRFTMQLALAVVLLPVTRFRSLRALVFAWPFFFYIAWLHLLRTDGFYIVGDWITREGLEAFGFYAIRTINVIVCGQWLGRFIPHLFKTVSVNLYLRGIGLALPLLPSIFGISIALGKNLLRQARNRNFANLLAPIVERLFAAFKENR